MPEIPIARGLVVCEQLLVDARSKNVSAINCFVGIGVSHFPSDPQRFSVYAALTNGLGSCTMKLEVVLLETDAVVYSRTIPMNFPNPLSEVRFSFRVHSCIFPQQGKYNNRLSANTEAIADAVIQVYRAEFDS